MDNRQSDRVIVAQMKPRERLSWTSPSKSNTSLHRKRLRRNTCVFAAVSVCLGAAAVFAASQPEKTQAVMSHLTAGFEYDDTLGRLQFVSNILPESAMVFLSSDMDASITQPTNSQVMHAWTQEEPWLEYACVGEVSACQNGEIITIVKNRQDEYTVRVLHDNGYESIYSGLSAVHLDENEAVVSGQKLGTAAGYAAFELRKDGLSILPVFSEI